MPANKANILFMDADKESRDAFKSNFESYYNIYFATSTDEAFEILANNKITVVIADQSIPSLTGIKFFEVIISEYPTTIRMLISNSKDASMLIEAINQGQIFRYITKPWDINEFKQSIDVGIKINELEQSNRDNINKMQEESLKMQRIISMLHKLAPGKVMDETAVSQSDSLFAGELRHLTILFVSIDSLNNLISKIEPPQALKFLTQYFTVMSKCIEEYGGTIDKFIGGSILVLFGAPISYIDSEKNAVFCALALLERIDKFNSDFSEKFGFTTNINIGIHSGEVVIGNVGSQQYISYTAIGDTVNTSSRIAELAKMTANSILISSSVYEVVKDDFKIDYIGKNEIRGKDVPIDLYKVTNKLTVTKTDNQEMVDE